jgi:hypothetical protein
MCRDAGSLGRMSSLPEEEQPPLPDETQPPSGVSTIVFGTFSSMSSLVFGRSQASLPSELSSETLDRPSEIRPSEARPSEYAGPSKSGSEPLRSFSSSWSGLFGRMKDMLDGEEAIVRETDSERRKKKVQEDIVALLHKSRQVDEDFEKVEPVFESPRERERREADERRAFRKAKAKNNPLKKAWHTMGDLTSGLDNTMGDLTSVLTCAGTRGSPRRKQPPADLVRTI